MAKSITELGDIMLRIHGTEAIEDAYGNTDPAWVGIRALDYGDINADGTTN